MLMKSAGVDLLSNVYRASASREASRPQECEHSCPGEGAGQAQGCPMHTGQCSMQQDILSDEVLQCEIQLLA